MNKPPLAIAAVFCVLAVGALIHYRHSPGPVEAPIQSRRPASPTARIFGARGVGGVATANRAPYPERDTSADLADSAPNDEPLQAHRPGGEGKRSGDVVSAPRAAAPATAGTIQPEAAPPSEPQAARGADNAPPGEPTPENEPVLSIPFGRSVDPEKGDTAPIIADGVTFDSEGARFSADSQFVVPNAGNISGAAGTINFWLQPEWAGDKETDASLVQLRTNTFENRLQIFKNGRYLRFLFCDNTGVESGVGTDITDWRPGERHMVSATWGDNVTILYIDGRWYGARDYDGELEIGPETPLYIGSDHPGGGPGARSIISKFQVYNRALSAEEITDKFSRGEA